MTVDLVFYMCSLARRPHCLDALSFYVSPFTVSHQDILPWSGHSPAASLMSAGIFGSHYLISVLPLPFGFNSTASAVIVAARGLCTYTTKARIVQEASGIALLVVNNEPGSLHPPGPDGKHLGKMKIWLLRCVR